MSTLIELGESGQWSRVVTVDPGLGGTGLCLWETIVRPPKTARPNRTPVPPLGVASISKKIAGASWIARSGEITRVFEKAPRP